MGFQEYKQKKKRKARKIVLAILGALILAAAVFVFGLCRVKEIEVEGNSRYGDSEIEELVMRDKYCKNSLYLCWKYRFSETEAIPFVDEIEASFVSPSRVRLRVYEKSLVGYVDYMDTKMYFDRDGIVVESSSEATEGIPEIRGLHFSGVALYEKLPVDDPAVFKTILNLTQLLKKYEIEPDYISFDREGEASLRYGDAKIALGADENLEGKVAQLPSIMPKLDGLSGTLHMENYSDQNKIITFDKKS